MAFAIAGFFADEETVIEDTDCIATSYPGFDQQLQSFLTPDENPPTPVINPAEILERN
jgi:3-phosphoshikimate 1-carboxyvinyltransferase